LWSFCRGTDEDGRCRIESARRRVTPNSGGTDRASILLAATLGFTYRSISDCGIRGGLARDGEPLPVDSTTRTGGSTSTVGRVLRYSDTMVEPLEGSW
jgi:hypothetical protein